MHPRKHKVIRLHQQRANRHFEDRRRINAVSIHTNRLGETFLFGRYGHRKNETLLTIGHFITPTFLKTTQI